MNTIRSSLLILSGVFILISFGAANKIIIPMDLSQTDHLKAYGLVYWILKHGINVEWLLNYRGGTFLTDDFSLTQSEARLRGVFTEIVEPEETMQIFGEIQESNMDVMLLEKAPKIAVYTPPNKQPWDDAVTLVLTYAEIPFDKIWDEDVFNNKLDDYDWLHLHHEDFTGQYSKFFRVYSNAEWYIKQKNESENLAQKCGYKKVSTAKGAVSLLIHNYVNRGGFLFAMCCATNTLDIALAAYNTDICDAVFDGDGPDPGYREKLDFKKCLAFTDFEIDVNPFSPNHCNIDFNHVNSIAERKEALDFTLFDFSAKYDPVPCMLIQNHVNYIKGFFGLCTSFKKSVIKRSVTILGEAQGAGNAKYLHGNLGKGQFTFLGGHDPEDFSHLVGDAPTELRLHKNSPGYRLILNNVLFPAAKKKKRKT
ncbi:MAG: asparagine synthetase B [bacterium]